eukprot:COSAG02_NODE_2160_length_9627_cov_17.846558_5_plen_48_part_00
MRLVRLGSWRGGVERRVARGRSGAERGGAERSGAGRSGAGSSESLEK